MKPPTRSADATSVGRATVEEPAMVNSGFDTRVPLASTQALHASPREREKLVPDTSIAKAGVPAMSTTVTDAGSSEEMAISELSAGTCQVVFQRGGEVGTSHAMVLATAVAPSPARIRRTYSRGEMRIYSSCRGGAKARRHRRPR